MRRERVIRQLGWGLTGVVLLGWAASLRPTPAAEPATSRSSTEPLTILVMDPLALQLACACVEGYAQRDYLGLAQFLTRRLGRRIRVEFAESILGRPAWMSATPHLIIGTKSVVESDAAAAGLELRALAMLTDPDGKTTLTGLFVVRQDDPAKAIADLRGQRIVLGPSESEEKHGAALRALKAHGLQQPAEPKTSPSCNSAAYAVIEGEADAAVISSYAKPLLEGCGIIDKGLLRVVGETEPVPFITVFATQHLQSGAGEVLDALLAVAEDETLLKAMESKRGFVAMTETGTGPSDAAPAQSGWTDWRGPNRDGISPHVPAKLPAEAKFLWRHPLEALALAGVAANDQYVVTADKNAQLTHDIFVCLDADTGKERWRLSYPAPEEMDYSNSARATPVIHKDMVYVLGAFGDLHCLKLATGEVVWKRNIARDFGAEVPQWGYCGTPLIVDDKLIVNPGAEDASLAALDLATGSVIWRTPGRPTAYSSFIVGTFGGVRQLVGYDPISLGGWEIETGKRRWELIPEESGDFNVPTPVAIGGSILLSSENNGTRIYDFDDTGKIIAEPRARNADLWPDTSTPVVLDGLVFGTQSRLICLDAGDGLKTLWELPDEELYDHASLLAGNGHVLIVTQGGEVLLLPAQRSAPAAFQRLRVFEKAEIWSHPALVEGRLYIRNQDSVVCLLLP